MELPYDIVRRYMRDFEFTHDEAEMLVEFDIYDNFMPYWCNEKKEHMFEICVLLGGDPRKVFNWIFGDYSRLLNESGMRSRESKITPRHLVELISLVDSGAINNTIAKKVLEFSFKTGEMPSEVVKAQGFEKIGAEDEIETIVLEVLAKHASVVDKYKGGNQNVKGFLIGESMKATKNMADPKVVHSVLDRLLAS